MRKKLVISAVNIVEGGMLKILIDALTSAVRLLGDEWDIVALVHRKSLIDIPGVELMEFPEAKRRWSNRVFFEYFKCRSLSREINPDLWLSLHDMSPFVRAKRQAVYCHNPAPFYRIPLKDIGMDWKFYLFTKFYAYLYRINIGSNDYVIVQQEWLRNAFERLYPVRSVIVAHPVGEELSVEVVETRPDDGKLSLIYPALPRSFKNVELLCEAVAGLSASERQRIALHLTIEGDENTYARWLGRRFKGKPGIHFDGRLARAEMSKAYAASDVVVFPSVLETWGLPLSEAKAMGKQILASDLPYAHEGVGDYDDVSFLSPERPEEWTQAFRAMLDGVYRPGGSRAVSPREPFARNWDMLWGYLTSGL